MSEFGLSVSGQYANITDDYLDQVVLSIQNEFPLCGTNAGPSVSLRLGFSSRGLESLREELTMMEHCTILMATTN
eukprot:Em0014g414a